KEKISQAEEEASKERGRAEELAVLQAQVVETQNKANAEQARITSELTRLIEAFGGGLAKLSHGDLTARMDDGIPDAYRQIRDDFNATVNQLAGTVSGIIVSAREVSNAASEISGSTTDLSQRTEGQAQGLEETTASLEKISEVVKHNVDNARKASQFAA